MRFIDILVCKACIKLSNSIPVSFQPLFPGDSGVDQLVEIIKVIAAS